ncbi:MAG: cytochrome c3 family protein [Calditrichaceae bacterium]
MAQIFPKWTNKLPLYIVIGVIFGGLATVGFFWYYGSPKYTDVGYRPVQPVEYSHKLHAGDLGMDCRYCHTSVEISEEAIIPPTQTCMNCHTLIRTESEKLLPVRESWSTGDPIQWVRVHNLPDFAYFKHNAHVRAGIGCESCHGNVAAMEVVEQKEPLSMSWCIDCHRNPEPFIRPHSDITKMNWKPPANQFEFARRVIDEKKIKPPVDCSGCHR